MKVGALVHFATPLRNAGSETVLHLMLKHLVEAGHEVVCWVTDCPGAREQYFEGVRLVPVRNITIALQQARRWKPDVMVSHHQNATSVMRYGRQWGVKTVYLTHNDMDVNRLPLRQSPDLVVHNSEWVSKSLAERFPHQRSATMIVHPPLDCSRHRVGATGDAVTLINVNEHKGGRIFYALAQRMHDVQFIAVEGGHGKQLPPPRIPNLSMVKHAPDLKPVWAQTRLLLMPSIYESYGLVGVEAGCSGIPTLANVTPGLKESLGSAGLFVSWSGEHLPRERSDFWNDPAWMAEWGKPSETHLNEWESAIRALLNEGYESASAASLSNSESKCAQTQTDLDLFVGALEELTQTQPVSA